MNFLSALVCSAVAVILLASSTATAAAQQQQLQQQQHQQQQQQQGVFFRETFDDLQDVFRSKWSKSADPKYTDQPVMIKHADRPPRGFERDKGLSLTQEMKYYGVSSKFPKTLHNADGGDIVLQYELKLEETLLCGGAYIKMPRVDGGGNLKKMNSETPYTIMFGPDKCGEDNDKVHFILQHQNPFTREWEEKHYKAPPPIKTDQLTHLYTLAIYGATNRFEIFIDKQSVRSGSFFDDMVPPMSAPKFVNDQSDIKPATWEDRTQVQDMTAVKPDSWDESIPRFMPAPAHVMPQGWLEEEPAYVEDPVAEKPEDWDDEEDGLWECPEVPNPVCELATTPGCGKWNPRRIPNPDYVGPWEPPLVDNPTYQGVWVPKQIPNPYYYEESHPAIVAPMSGIAVEVWTTSAGIHFDNFLITRSVEAAFNYSAVTFDFKTKAENAAKSKEIERAEREKIVTLKQSGKTWNIMLALLLEFFRSAKKNWKILLATTVCVMGALLFAYLSEMGNFDHAHEAREANEEESDDEEESDVDVGDISASHQEGKRRGRGAGDSSSGDDDMHTIGILSSEVQAALESLNDIDDSSMHGNSGQGHAKSGAGNEAKTSSQGKGVDASTYDGGLDNDDPRVEQILRKRLLALVAEQQGGQAMDFGDRDAGSDSNASGDDGSGSDNKGRSRSPSRSKSPSNTSGLRRRK